MRAGGGSLPVVGLDGKRAVFATGRRIGELPAPLRVPLAWLIVVRVKYNQHDRAGASPRLCLSHRPGRSITPLPMPTTPFSLELTQPAWLLATAALLVVVYYFFRSLVDFARWQRLASLAARMLIVLLVVLALAGLTLVRPTR